MIVFCGYANSDVTVRVPSLPTPGGRVQATALERGDGGMAANAAVAAARLGADVRFGGVVGTDALSAAFLEALEADGIDVRPTRTDGRLTTAIVLLTPDGERAIISQDDDLGVADIAEHAALADTGWLCLDGYRFPNAANVLPASAHVVVDLDGCETRPAALSALAVAEHVVLGAAQARTLLGDDAACAVLAADHGTHLVLTDGGRGATVFAPGEPPQRIPAIEVPVVDSTGAGDCFVGAYVSELAGGRTPIAAARFAAVAAGLSCTHAGARAGLPHRAAVQSFLDTGSAGPGSGHGAKEPTP